MAMFLQKAIVSRCCGAVVEASFDIGYYRCSKCWGNVARCYGPSALPDGLDEYGIPRLTTEFNYPRWYRR